MLQAFTEVNKFAIFSLREAEEKPDLPPSAKAFKILALLGRIQTMRISTTSIENINCSTHLTTFIMLRADWLNWEMLFGMTLNKVSLELLSSSIHFFDKSQSCKGLEKAWGPSLCLRHLQSQTSTLPISKMHLILLCFLNQSRNWEEELTSGAYIKSLWRMNKNMETTLRFVLFPDINRAVNHRV